MSRLSPGPLPDPAARRRNAPTIPTTNLPASGRKGPAPEVPSWIALGESGRAWWEWAWHTPQAAGWGVGAGQESVVARRAELEDMVSALQDVDGLDFDELCEADRDAHINFRGVVQRVAALATGHLQLTKEMRELDDRLGLTPKGMAALRWKIVQDVEDLGAATPPPAGASTVAGRRAHLAQAG